MPKAMNRDKFYALIEQARADHSLIGPSADADLLTEVLEPLNSRKIAAFLLRYDDEELALNTWGVWAVGYIIEGGMSDDSFDYFKPWIIGKGKAAVDLMLADPDNLPQLLPSEWEDGYLDNEDLLGTIDELVDEHEIEDPRYTPKRRALVGDREPRGEQFEEDDSVYEQYPKSAAYAQTHGNYNPEID